MFDARRRTPRCAWGVWLFDEAPRRERGAAGREQRGRLMLATIGCCGVSCRHRPRELVRSFSRHAIAHARDILCALALALALTPPAAVFGCKGWSIARAWLFGSSSGATPRVVGFGRSASAHSFLRRLASSGVCVFDARPVKQATEPSAPRARSRGQRRKLVEVVQSFARYRYI